MKITKHDDDKGRVGFRDPQETDGQVTMTQTIIQQKNKIYYETLMYEV